MQKIAIVAPVFNDWEAFGQLIREIAAHAGSLDCQIDILAIDDGSPMPLNVEFNPDELKSINSILVISLVCNVGHQRDIAIGLTQVYASTNYDAVLVMDSDGEDRPEDITRLMAWHRERPDAIIVAQR